MGLVLKLRSAATPLMRVWWRLTRSMTLGVRVIAVAPDGRVALVRHTYVEGWFLPGGGVDAGEPAGVAAARELAEEVGVEAPERPRLLGFYANFASFRGDHIALYRVDGVAPVTRPRDREIAEVRWCDPAEPPPETTPATLRALAREFFGAPASDDW